MLSHFASEQAHRAMRSTPTILMLHSGENEKK
jgi:hypothetical protein